METELILRPKKFAYLACAVLCAGFAASGFWASARGDQWGWAVATFFSLMLLMFGFQLLPSASYLRLTTEGFWIRSLFRTHHYRWADIARFSVGSVGQYRMVVFNFVEQYPSHRGGRAFAKLLADFENALPDTYGRSPEELAEIMTDWKNGERTLDGRG